MNNTITIKKRGSFYVGGEKITLKSLPIEDISYMNKFTFHSDPNGTHWVKQMYVQYTEITQPKISYPVLMWHGGGLTGVTWETTPDGRDGWDTLFLKMGYHVFISDAVERGRASWAKFPEINPTPPIFHTYEARWLNLKMGETYPVPYKGLRFPIKYYDQLMMQSVPRWLTSDQWAIDAYIQYIKKMQCNYNGVIIIAHSQGCLYAQEIMKKFPDFIKAVIFVENVCLPKETENLSAFSHIPQLYIYGDFMDKKIVHDWVNTTRNAIPKWKLYLNKIHADHTWMELPKMGISGNSHMLMMDNNNHDIAKMIDNWLTKKFINQ